MVTFFFPQKILRTCGACELVFAACCRYSALMLTLLSDLLIFQNLYPSTFDSKLIFCGNPTAFILGKHTNTAGHVIGKE